MSKATPRQAAAAALAAILLALTACGTTRNIGGDISRTGAASPHPSDAADEKPRTASAAEDPYNLGGRQWPTDLAAAKAFYETVPATFENRPVKHPRFFAGATGVTYGQGVIAWSMEADKSVPYAHAVLAVMFGMTMSCDKSTYRGTATPEQGGRIPGAGPEGDADPWWFSCRVNGAEGSPHHQAFAVGWTSGDLGWLVLAPDEKVARELVNDIGAGA